MSDDLVKRLRGCVDAYSSSPYYSGICVRLGKAADRIEELEAKLEKVVKAVKEIDDKVRWEINLSNYDHQQVCDLNADWCEVGNIARTTLAELEDKP